MTGTPDRIVVGGRIVVGFVTIAEKTRMWHPTATSTASWGGMLRPLKEVATLAIQNSGL
ncbi:hypothetical protein [Novipirellula aureliae]|uniref:hypothetical protein n=1 Tax=Novipirellula aureliae TaxID=2527966 RepID=UPI0018CD1600|nr:hypothetical protein [Novipirellula aureliae]